MKYTEDDLTSAIIKYQKEERSSEIQKIETESHYNNYGSRGYVDLLVKTVDEGRYSSSSHLHLYEVKSDLTKYSANEVVRQFTKMHENFIAGSNHRPGDTNKVELSIIPSRKNYEWLISNKELIRNIFEKYDNSIVCFRHPEDISPVHIFTSTVSIGDSEWQSHLKAKPKTHSAVKGVTRHE